MIKHIVSWSLHNPADAPRMKELLEMFRHARLQVTLGAMLSTALLLWLLPAHYAMLGGLAAGALLGALYTGRAHGAR